MGRSVPQSAKVIGRNLKNLRKSFGFSRKEVAAVLRVSYQQIQKYEDGLNRFPVDNLQTLRQFYDVPYKIFFEGLEKQVGAAGDFVQMPDDVALFLKFKTMKNTKLKEKIGRVIAVLIE